MARVFLLEFCDKVNHAVRGPVFRLWGKSLIQGGLGIMGEGYVERVNPSMRGVDYDGVVPELENTFFVAPNSTIIGNVAFGNESSAWYGTILRGENNRILIGDRVIIQDNAKIYSRSKQTSIGDNILIGPNCTIDSSTIEDDCFIGAGAYIGQGCYIESGAFVAAGSIIPDGTTVPSGEIWVGNPGVCLRNITAEERENFAEQLDENIKLSVIHNEETKKTMRQVINSDELLSYRNNMDYFDKFNRDMMKRGLPIDEDEIQYIEQRLDDVPASYDLAADDQESYEQDLSSFPDSYKKYSRNFERYQDLQNFFEDNMDVAPEFVGEGASTVNNRGERASKY